MAQSVKGNNLKLNLDQHELAYQDGEEGRESTATKKLKLASARNTRPPKGISSLCSTSNKVTDTDGTKAQELQQKLSNQRDGPGTDVKLLSNYIPGKKTQNSQSRRKESNRDYNSKSSPRRKRMKST